MAEESQNINLLKPLKGQTLESQPGPHHHKAQGVSLTATVSPKGEKKWIYIAHQNYLFQLPGEQNKIWKKK